MPSPAAPFKAAEEQALRGSMALAAAMGGKTRLYVEVPTNAPLPYVVHGQHEILDDSGGCGAEYSIVSTVQWWAMDSDMVRAMGEAIVEALNVELTIPGFRVVLVEMELSESYATDPDGSSRGRVAFRHETSALT